jgi:hypothetical protein
LTPDAAGGGAPPARRRILVDESVTLACVRRASNAEEALHAHLKAYFDNSLIERRDCKDGPVHVRVPEFAVYACGPGSRLNLWSYITTGCWSAVNHDGHGLEFVLSANADSDRHVELLAMLAYYHAGPVTQQLDYGHTVPIGEPWVPGSACTHGLIALPYAYGPDFEICSWPGGHIRILAVQPITEDERDFKVAHGMEALERQWERASIAFADPKRASGLQSST